MMSNITKSITEALTKVLSEDMTRLNENQVANTILDQLGGRRFILFTGAKNLLAGKNYLTMKIGTNPKKITHVKITLNGNDLYDLEFMKIRGTTPPVIVSKTEDIYAEDLQDIFTKYTGLYTNF